MRDDQSGFTLLETLVAFSILMLGLVAVFQALGIGFFSLNRSQAHALLLDMARSQMARAGTELPLAVGSWSGEADDIVWTIEIASVSGAAPSQQPAQVEAYWVEITAADAQHAPVTLRTIKLGETR